MTTEDPTTSTPIPPPPGPVPSTPQPPPAAPSRRRQRTDSGRGVSLVFGVILLVIGLWYFATRTLGLDLPDLDWGNLWPLILIGLGVWVVFRSMRRSR